MLKKPNPGFIGNYLQFGLWAAALKLLEDGVCDPEDIDNCLAYSFCPRYTSIGMFEHFDNGGYQLNASTCDNVFPFLPRYEGAPDIVREKAESTDAWGGQIALQTRVLRLERCRSSRICQTSKRLVLEVYRLGIP